MVYNLQLFFVLCFTISLLNLLIKNAQTVQEYGLALRDVEDILEVSGEIVADDTNLTLMPTILKKLAKFYLEDRLVNCLKRQVGKQIINLADKQIIN